MKNIILYWPRFFKELLFSIKYYRAVKSIQEELEKENLRVDWIGRIYTVIILKEELIKQPELMQQSWIFQQLKPISQLLLKYGLSDSAFPEITKINATSYLIVLYPENDNANIYSFIRNILFAGTLGFIVYGIVSTVKNFI